MMNSHHRLGMLVACVYLCSSLIAVGAETRPATSEPVALSARAAISAPEWTRNVVSYEGVHVERDLDYLAPGRKEKLDLYRPAQLERDRRYPGIVIIHGGGWIAGDKGSMREQNIATNLARHGYICVSINYDLATKQRPSWPRNLYDCKAAVKFLRFYADRYQVNPDHIGVLGGSAGGHLAAMVALAGSDTKLDLDTPYPGISSQVQAAVIMYGITNLLTRKQTTPAGKPIAGSKIDGGVPFMLGAARTQFPDLWRMASPVSHVNANDPPLLILHGTADTTVDYDQSVELARRCQQVGVPVELILLDGAPHTFHLQPPQRDLRPVVIGFFDKHLKGHGTTRPTGSP